MNVWILQTGEPLHCDDENARPMRAMNLANKLLEQGHDVTIFSSNFYHQQKRHRFKEQSTIQYSKNLRLVLIDSPGYQSNIALSRLWDHLILSINLKRFLKNEVNLPDIGFVGYPPIEAAFTFSRYLIKNKVPYFLDLKDQWPHLFVDAFPKPIRFIPKIVFSPYFWLGRATLRGATKFTSISDSYIRWMKQYAEQDEKESLVVPLTSPFPSVSKDEKNQSLKWFNSLFSSRSSVPVFSFVGSLSSVFDFSLLLKAVEKLTAENVEFNVVIAGDGEQRSKVESMFARFENVVFPGWIDYPKVNVLYQHTTAAIIPYRELDSFVISVPNKVIDALAHGVPLISSLPGEVEELIKTYQDGISIAGNLHDSSFYITMKKMIIDPELVTKLKKSIEKVFKSRFEYNKVYGELVDALKRTVNHE